MPFPRRTFLKSSSLLATAFAFPHFALDSLAAADASELPVGNAPAPVPFPHFPDRLHAFVFRNWPLVPLTKLAAVLDASPDRITALAHSMGLPDQKEISAEQQRRSYITIIRRNWHLLPYDQLLQLLDWTPAHMEYMLREDDFLFIKLGSHKPKCDPLRYTKPDEKSFARAREISAILAFTVPDAFTLSGEPLFSFLRELSSAPPKISARSSSTETNRAPRFCYSYFALYGDPLLEPSLDPYPEPYLQRLASIGVNGVWLQAVLQKLAPFPWISETAAEKTDREKRIANLRALAKKAARHGIGIYLYLNEPRTMPQAFFVQHPDLKGVPVGEYASLCTSNPEVRKGLTDAVAHIAAAVPDLAGFFTISASENPTNCWSHGQGRSCPRCSKRSAGEVIAEVNTAFYNGIQQAGSKADLIAWDWGWRDELLEEIIQRLPTKVALQSVSEWSIPIKRGGIDSVVGEYSISTVGPGPRATKHWDLARQRGLRTIAKIQAGNTWELSAVPYIPAVENVARHVAQLKQRGVDGLMLGWTLGGYPSPNLQIACDISSSPREETPIEDQVQRAMNRVATDRFGPELALAVVRAWKSFSTAFSEFPYHIGTVYNAPMQSGPSNLLWAKPTGYRATMVGFPYDDLTAWRQVYPPKVFVDQFRNIADGFDAAIATLKEQTTSEKPNANFQKAVEKEISVATAASIHFRSTANQARFVELRDQLQKSPEKSDLRDELIQVLRSEVDLARQLYRIQSQDSRIGFEATNHYFYIPQDLLEKIINCEHLIAHYTRA
jgi:hypothetical protein